MNMNDLRIKKRERMEKISNDVYELALKYYRQFGISNETDKQGIKEFIENYYFSLKIPSSMPNTVALSAVYFVMKKNNDPFLGLKSFNEVFKINPQSIKNCLEQIIKKE
ncbi:MAG: hypothetical protein PHG04_01960 [Candidatus Nanoarchaeia archaeon]|nr:hypothetical protein [Candidatus Nanoarchaeia archaeon]